MKNTQHGKPVYRVDSEIKTQLMDDSLAFLKLVNIADRDISSGRVMTLDEAMQALIEE